MGDLVSYSIVAFRLSRLERQRESQWKIAKTMMNPTDKKTGYKGTMGDKAINMQITSTAWNKLQCHSTKTETSKARIVQRLILNYQPTSQTKRDQSKAYRERNNVHKTQKAQELEPLRREDLKRWKYFQILSYGAVVHKKSIPQSKWTDGELQEYVQIMEMQQTKMRNKLADQDYEMLTSTDPEGQPTTSTASTSTTDKQHREVQQRNVGFRSKTRSSTSVSTWTIHWCGKTRMTTMNWGAGWNDLRTNFSYLRRK